jgi:DNA-binding Xre family transcriptional regulator
MPLRLSVNDAMARANCSARELARRIGAHVDTVSRYRHDAIRTVSLDLLEAMCAALNCHLTDLVHEDAPGSPHRTGTRPPAAPRAVPPPPAPPPPPRTPTFPDGTPIHPLSTWSWDDLRAFRNAWSTAWWACLHGRGPDGTPVGPDGRRWPPLSRWTQDTVGRFSATWEQAWLAVPPPD